MITCAEIFGVSNLLVYSGTKQELFDLCELLPDICDKTSIVTTETWDRSVITNYVAFSSDIIQVRWKIYWAEKELA